MLDLSKLEAVTQTSDGKPILFDISEIRYPRVSSSLIREIWETSSFTSLAF